MAGGESVIVAVGRAAREAVPWHGRTCVVAIDGRSGAGKTSLAAGLRAARVPRYDWVAAAWGTPWVLEPPEVLIVEGVGAGAGRAAAYESVLVWIEVPAPVRKKRALDRDGETFAPHWDMWAVQEDAMLACERTPDRADLVITVTGTAAGRSSVTQ